MVAVTKINCQPLSTKEISVETLNNKSHSMAQGVSFKGEGEDVFDPNLFEEQGKLEEKIGATNELFEEIHGKSVDFLEKNTFGKILKPFAKAGCIALVGTMGFFFGKFALANKFIKGILGTLTKKADKLVKLDIRKHSDKFYGKIVDGFIKLQNKANGISPDNETNKFKKFTGKAFQKIVNFTKKFAKEGVIDERVQTLAAEAAEKNGLKEVTPELLARTTQLAEAHNFVLKTAGALAGTVGAVDASLDAIKADMKEMPAVVEKHAKKAGAAAILG